MDQASSVRQRPPDMVSTLIYFATSHLTGADAKSFAPNLEDTGSAGNPKVLCNRLAENTRTPYSIAKYPHPSSRRPRNPCTYTAT